MVDYLFNLTKKAGAMKVLQTLGRLSGGTERSKNVELHGNLILRLRWLLTQAISLQRLEQMNGLIRLDGSLLDAKE